MEAERRQVSRGGHRPQDGHRHHACSAQALHLQATEDPTQDRRRRPPRRGVARPGRRGLRRGGCSPARRGRPARHRPAPADARPSPQGRRGTGQGRHGPRGPAPPAPQGAQPAAVGRRRRHGEPVAAPVRRADERDRRSAQAPHRPRLRRCSARRTHGTGRGLRRRRRLPAAPRSCRGWRLRRCPPRAGGAPGEEGDRPHRRRGAQPGPGRGRRDLRDRRRRPRLRRRRPPTARRRVPHRGVPQGHGRGQRHAPRAPRDRRPTHRPRSPRLPLRALRQPPPPRHRPQRGLDPHPRHPGRGPVLAVLALPRPQDPPRPEVRRVPRQPMAGRSQDRTTVARSHFDPDFTTAR